MLSVGIKEKYLVSFTLDRQQNDYMDNEEDINNDKHVCT
jgi:hypothetical protein